MIHKLLFYPLVRRKLNKKATKGHLYQILIERDAQFKPIQYNNFFDSIYTLYDPKRPFQWLSFEFHGTARGIRIYTWLPDGVTWDFMQSNINSVHPLAEVVPVEKDYINFNGYASCGTLELDNHFIFNLLQTDGERTGADVMASICASMQNLGDNEEVYLQFLLRPVEFRTLSIATAYFEHYKRFGSRPGRLHMPYSFFTPYTSDLKALYGALRHACMGTAGKPEYQENMLPIQRKLEAGIYFDLTIRIVALNTPEKLSTVISAFAPATDKNRFRPYADFKGIKRSWTKKSQKEKFLEDFALRKIPTYPLENFVTPAELASILHFPSKDIPGIIRLRSKKLPVPEGIIQYNSISEAWKDGAFVFGVSNFRGRIKYLAFKDIKMLMQHAYVIGATGSGKSYYLIFLVIQVALKTGITFFDVKGDAVDVFLQYLPKSEWARVVYIDLHDQAWFIPFNILRQEGMSVYNLASMIVGVFIKVFSDGSIKEHSQNVLRQALIAVISTDPKGSILEVYRMFTDENYLDLTIKRLQENNEYPDVLHYWKNSYKKMKPSGRKTESHAIINKLQVFTQNERPRFTFSQTDNLLKWRKLLDEKAIILANLSMGQNEDEILNFFGTMFTAFISKAIFSRDDIREVERVPHLLILDEFERFVANEGDMKKFLEMARSYGLGLVLAHQSVEQIPKKLLGMIQDNTFSQISLNLGTGSNKEIAPMFPGTTSEDFINLDVYQGFARFKKLHPATFTFSSLAVEDYFKDNGFEEVQKFKKEYKKKYYKHLFTIKDEINKRYSLIEKNVVTDNDNDSEVRKGNATGKLKRRKLDNAEAK